MAVDKIKALTKMKIETISISHGDITAGTASTKQVNVSYPKDKTIIGSPYVTGSYNSDVIPWSYYLGMDGSQTVFISRVKNTGSNKATGISVSYTIAYEG